VARRAQARYLGHQNLIRFFLRALGNEVKPFCSPLATVMVKAAFGEAPALGAASAVAVPIGGPSPVNNPAGESLISRVIDTSLDGNCG
jgi:hypothetical protein